MKDSIFDSKEEQKLFTRLKKYWSKYVEIFPQQPVSKIVNYTELQKRGLGNLNASSFDFVICELNTGNPILIVEFDGWSRGHSSDWKYISKVKNPSTRDKNLEKKLGLCEELNIPMVVVALEETETIPESEDKICILDAIIGDALEKLFRTQHHPEYVNDLTEAYENGGEEAADAVKIYWSVMQENNNPLRDKIREITQDFPYWPTQILSPIEKDHYLSRTFNLDVGIKTQNEKTYTQRLLSVDVKIRNTAVWKEDSFFLFNLIGEYCLARKTQKILGNDPNTWSKILENTAWTLMN